MAVIFMSDMAVADIWRSGRERRDPTIAEIQALQQGIIMSALYDSIGINYADLRKPDPRIARTIEQALGAAKTILNVGAGTGS